MTETLNTGASALDTTPAPAGHDAQMAQAFDAAHQAPAEAPVPDAPDRPAWLPEKFQSAEDLAKAAELRASGTPKEELYTAIMQGAHGPEDFPNQSNSEGKKEP